MRHSFARPQVVLALGVLMAATVALGGCSAPRPPAEDPSIIGTVTEMTPGEGGEATLLLEAFDPSISEYDVAWVRITRDTRVLEATSDDAYAPADADSIGPGLALQVWFTGPVAESYPVQAVAGTIVIVR